MSNNIIKAEETNYSKDLQVFRELCSVAVKSGNYQITEATMLNIMLSAKDYGISPMKAINGGFYVVNGKICMSTALMADRIRKAGHSIKVIEWSSQKCVIIGQRKDNGDSVKVEFTMDDAHLAGLLASPTWKKYPKAMLYNRAMSMLSRVLFPDVVGNCYSEDEGEEIESHDMPKAKASDYRQEIELTPEIDVKEASHRVGTALGIEDIELLDEYIAYCQKAMAIPLSEAVEKWIESPEKFTTCYDRWVSKKRMTEIEVETIVQ